MVAPLTGHVVRRGDVAYETVRRGWNRLHSSRPQAIVFCSSAQDVGNALTWAQEQGVAVRVRSGGHCLEGWSSIDDGLVVDVSRLTSVRLDADARTATVGAGLSQLQAVTALGRAGFATPTGTEGSVGLAGATLGGGFGLLTRAFGMASDNLLSAQVVVASPTPTVLVADQDHHADLLWALRGAGNGSLGVVTSMTYAIHPMPLPVYVTATWSGLDDLLEVVDRWQASAPHVDPRLTSQLEIHRDEILLFAVLTSGTPAEAHELLAPVLSVGSPEVSATQRNWADTYAAFQIPLDVEPAYWKFSSQFVDRPLPGDALRLIEEFMRAAPTADCNYFTNAFGGAVTGSEPPGGSVFAHRRALFYAEPGAGWGTRGAAPPPDDLTDRCLAWVADFGAALQPYVRGAYVNVPNPGMPQWESAYWGPNVERLRSVKAAYDPHHVFRGEQVVSPASAVRDEPRLRPS